jgi:hypothetical protein
MHPHPRRPDPLIAAIALLCVTGCQSTTLKTTWKDPSAGKLDFTKVVAVVLNSSPAERRAQEDTLAARVKGVEVVPSYSFIPDEVLADGPSAKQRIIDGSFDGALVLRLVDTSQRTTYVPPAVATWDSGPVWGSGPYYSSYYTSPAYAVTDTFVRAEISLYVVPSGKLLWAGASETVNPADARELAGEVVEAAAGELRKQGMLD